MGIFSSKFVHPLCPGCLQLPLCVLLHPQDRSRDIGMILPMWPSQALGSSRAWHPVQVSAAPKQVTSLNKILETRSLLSAAFGFPH